MFTHAKTRSLLFQADPAAIASVVPSTALSGPGFSVAAKHTPAATLALRNLGYDAPSPIVSYYDWPKYQGRFNPFGHQNLIAEFLTLYRRCFDLAEMGAGKTNATLWAIDWMMNEGIIEKTVITTPLSTLERVWFQSAVDTIMHRKVVIVHGTREQRLAKLATKADIYIINHDGLTIKAVANAIRRLKPDLYVVDEGSKFRNAKTDKYRALEGLLSDPRIRLWWTTGTPTPKSPADALAQCRLVNPASVPRFYGQFRSQVCVEVSPNIWKPRTGHEAIVHAAMQPAIRIAKEDCLDLPPMTTVDWAVEMSAEQKVAYKAMAEAMQIADTASKEQGKVITAVNAADRVNKLRQIMLGSVKSGEDDYMTFDYSSRYKLLCEGIEMAKAKVIVIAPFKGIIKDLHAKLDKDYGCGMVNGDVSITKRNKIFADFKDPTGHKVLLAHPQVMSHGLNLTEADVLIMFGPIYSNDDYRQVVERFNRPPQDKKMTVIRIGCNPVEWAIYKSLDTDEGQQQLILNLYRSIIGKKG